MALLPGLALAGCEDDPLLFADPEAIEAVSPTEQLGTVSMPAPEVPTVRVVDRRGNPAPGVPVAFQVVGGNGRVESAEAITDSRGLATPGDWTLGTTTGPNRLEARLGELEPVAFEVEALVGIEVAQVHVNQSNQNYPGTVPLLEGRPGLLRVFLEANAPNQERPDVRVRLYDGDAEVASLNIPPTAVRVPTSVEPDNPAGSWNVEIPAELITGSFGIQVVADEEEEMEVEDRTALTWPAEGEIFRPEVTSTPPFRTTFVRIFSEDLNTTADLHEENLDDYMSLTLDIFPIAEHDARIREGTYTSNASPLSGENQGTGWRELLDEIHLLRFFDGQDNPSALERYYHGIIRRAPGPGIAGIAYVATNPDSDALAAVSHDTEEGRARTVAHEFGHNFGRHHAPCGNAANPDGNYPHANARLGSPGYSIARRALIPAGSSHRDIMSYCSPAWISDYSYEQVFQMREARPIGSPPAAAGPVEGILVSGAWGRDEGASLRPVLSLRSVPVGTGPGPAELRGFDAEGRLLFRQGVGGLPVDHVDDPTIRHFHAFIPLPTEQRDALARVELDTPRGSASRESPVGQPGGPLRAPSPEIRVERVPPPAGAPAGAAGAASWARVRWDADAYPQTVLRDGGSGRVLSIARDGEIRIPAPGSGRLNVQLSDGVRSLWEEIRIP